MDSELSGLLGEIKVSYVRGDPRFKKEQLDKNLIVEIAETDHLQRRGRKMEKKINEVTDSVNTAIKLFGDATGKLVAAEQAVTEQSKKATGNLRDCATKLADGIQRLEKTANFDRLERYVTLIERAATAMNSLADLEKSGKLDKIASALK